MASPSAPACKLPAKPVRMVVTSRLAARLDIPRVIQAQLGQTREGGRQRARRSRRMHWHADAVCKAPPTATLLVMGTVGAPYPSTPAAYLYGKMFCLRRPR